MSIKKTLLGIVGVPLALVLAYSGANYIDARVQGKEVPLITAPRIENLDPVMTAGVVGGLYLAKYNRRKRENDNCR